MKKTLLTAAAILALAPAFLNAEAKQTKAPATVKKANEKPPLFTQKDLTRGGKDIGNGIRRMETAGQGVSGFVSTAKDVAGGKTYTIAFEAKGNDNLIVMLTGEGFKRIDPLKSWQPLSGNWKKFKADFDLPAGAKKASVTFFYWKQPGKWFEIRNFSIVPR